MAKRDCGHSNYVIFVQCQLVINGTEFFLESNYVQKAFECAQCPRWLGDVPAIEFRWSVLHPPVYTRIGRFACRSERRKEKAASETEAKEDLLGFNNVDGTAALAGVLGCSF